ncbi:MAG TPA: glycoside hydrolase family 15 protein, partial [Methanomicrobiales archaeon]|nr:glycoside hydrolase family 15 protein [Methanomicrobiales archaeon]
LINALIRAGRMAEAQTLYENLVSRASPLGLFAEELDPRSGSHRGNFPQALSHIGAINAAVSFAHAGYTGRVKAHHAAAAEAAGHGGGGQKKNQKPASI